MGHLTFIRHLHESNLWHQIKLHMKAISAAFWSDTSYKKIHRWVLCVIYSHCLGCQFSPQLYCSSGAKLWWAYQALHGSSSSRHLGKNLTSVKVTLVRTRLLDKEGDTSALETQLSFLHENTAASYGADRNLRSVSMLLWKEDCFKKLVFDKMKEMWSDVFPTLTPDFLCY